MKTSRYLMLVAAAAMAFTGCQKEVNSPVEVEAEAVTIKVNATADDLGNTDTKTYIDETNTILWGTGEYMTLAVTAGKTTVFTTSTETTADLWSGDPTAMFEFSVTPETAASYLYQGLYPASAAVSSSNTDPAKYKVELSDTQNASAASYDPAAYIMVAKPEPFEVVKTEWTASFRRATALNKVTLTNLADDITSVEFTAPEGTVLTGRRYFDLSTGESGEVYYNQSNSVTVKFAAAQNGTVIVWFTSWDTELSEGDAFKIVAKSATKSYTRTLTINSNGLKFKEGNLNKLSVNMASAAVETISGLAAGNYLILAKNGENYYALRNAADGARLAYVTYTGSLESYQGEADLVWTVATSGTNYTIANDGKFLGATEVKTAKTEDASESFTEKAYLLSIDDNNDGTYKVYHANNTTWILAKNNDSKYGFAFYTGSGYKDIVFVPASVDTREQVATPTFSPEEGQVEANTEVTISTVTTGAEIYYTTDASAEFSTETWTKGNTVTIDAAKTIRAIAVKDGFKDSEIAEAAYTLQGVQENGWIETELSDILSEDIFVIVGNGKYAIANDASTSAGPKPVSVTVLNNKLSGSVADNVKWTLSGNSETGYTFFSNATPSNYLYCNTTASSKSNDNIRVGSSGSRKLFILEESHLKTKDTYTARYIGINGTSDFRGYVSSSTSSVTFKFYKFNDSRTDAELSWSESVVNATKEGSTITFSAPTLTNPASVAISSYTSSNPAVATINATTGEVTIVGGGTTIIKAIFDGDGTYKPAKASYTLNVTDNTTYTITCNSNNDSYGTVSANSASAKADATVTLTITPAEGYKLTSIAAVDASSNPIELTTVDDTHRTFTMPASDVAVNAEFTTSESGDDDTKTEQTIYYETFGTSGNNTAISSYTGWAWTGDIKPVSTAWKISKDSLTGNDSSSEKYDDASGSCNLYSGTSNGAVTFAFGNVSSYSDVKLSFGWANAAGKGKNRTLKFEVSGDGGTNWTEVTFTTSVNSTTNDGFHYFTYDVASSLLSNFSIRFTNTSSNTSRIDDVKLVGKK